MPANAPHLFTAEVSLARRAEFGLVWLLRGATWAILLAGAVVFGTIFFKGAQTVFQSSFPFINVAFLTEAPASLYVFEHEGKTYELADRDFREFRAELDAAAAAQGQPPPELDSTTYVYAAGGVFPNIVGTLLLVAGSMTIALVLGVASAIYLSEYAKPGAGVRFIRLAIINLAGVPSIVFGLFGFGLFVIFFGWNVSLLAGWFTLAFMVLPVVITASEESLKMVPRGYREAALALGATRWQTIRRAVLPHALPGILTSSILGIGRVAGETAPIMFTAAYVMRDELPWEVERFFDFFFQGVMALPYHIYVVSSKIPQSEYAEGVQYGTAFVFVMLVALITSISILLRYRIRSRHQG